MATTALPAIRHPLDDVVTRTVQLAMLIFVWTIGIGILNGLDLVDFTRQQLLSHLHGGTLGWMTLGILAATMWLFGTPDPGEEVDDAQLARIRPFAMIAMIAVPLYVAAFATTLGIARPIGGTATLIALIGFGVWAFMRARQITLGVPHLLVLLGLTSSVIGGAFGVIMGMAIAMDWTWVPDSFFEAHPGTMDLGFAMPVAMGLSEWALRIGTPTERPQRAGKIQVALMFIAFAWVLTFLLASQPDLVGPGILFGIVAIGIFYKRVWSLARATSFTARLPSRHAVASAVFLGITFVYIFVIITKAQGEFEDIPQGQALSFIHLMAIGATTNALLAFVIHLSRSRSVPNLADDVIFWGVNIGLTGFVVALTTDVRGLIFVFVPIMGAALLAAIATHVMALRTPAPADP